MKSEEDINYNNNTQAFIDNMKSAFVKKIYFDLDTNPCFDIQHIPFNFKYCYSITIVTNADIFTINTAMNSDGDFTFSIHSTPATQYSPIFQDVDSLVKSINATYFYDSYAYKIELEFENSNLILYAGEIYDQVNGFRCTIYDEMILVFENKTDADIFEQLSLLRTPSKYK